MLQKRRRIFRGAEPLLWFVLGIVPAGAAPDLQAELTGRVIDENGSPVAGVKVSLSRATLEPPLITVSDDAGRFRIFPVPPGTYEMKAEKPGYYATVSRALEVREAAPPLEVVINHVREFEETVSVVHSSPVIDRQAASTSTMLTAEEITDLPYVATHDFRNSLPLIPGVIKDNNGHIHLNGGGENQVYYALDGFNITSPGSGTLENRISVDAIRAVRVETSGYSAEYGKGSAGVMAMESSQGDDRTRFSATNFIPSFEVHSGLVLSNWTPRVTVSGPISKGQAWYFTTLDLQYSRNIIHDLPEGADTNTNWLGSTLSRIQVNLPGGNILSGGFLANYRSARHFGLSPLDPVETTRNLQERFFFFNVKDQAFLKGGWILETGFALNRIHARENPMGSALYVISPSGNSGNYYVQSEDEVERIQALASVLSPVLKWHGRHSIKFGVDAERIRHEQASSRGPFIVVSSAGEVTRAVSFRGNSRLEQNNAEYSGFLQDRWTLNEQWFVEAGLRFDRDEILRRSLWSPRLALTWGPGRFPESKLSAGLGVFCDATNLQQIASARDQQRLDTFFTAAGVPLPGSPWVSRFIAAVRTLEAPCFLNWSMGWQQKLRRGFYLNSQFIRKKGRHGWAYDVSTLDTGQSRQFAYTLGAARRDRYSYAEIGISRTFGGKYPWLLSYAYSNANASAVIDFTLENPVFSRQAGGPLDWDTPHRLISWGVLPVPRLKKYTLAYFADWHSGLPWSTVNQFQQLVGAPNGCRFPQYFSLNLHVERRIRAWRSEWALRVGFNNLTGHDNPTVVNNNLDSNDYGRFLGSQGRVFTGRIRFLGKY